MKKTLAALGITGMILMPFALPNQAQAQSCPATNPCVSIKGGDVVVVVLGREVARVPAPVKTIEVSTPIPGPTRTILVPVPGPTKTIKVPVPGPTRTVTKTVPGPVRTVTVQASPPTPTLTPEPRSTGQAPSPSATVEPERVEVPGPERVVTITRDVAAGISIALLLLGVVLGLLAVYFAGWLARRQAQKEEARNLSDLRDDLFSKE